MTHVGDGNLGPLYHEASQVGDGSLNDMRLREIDGDDMPVACVDAEQGPSLSTALLRLLSDFGQNVTGDHIRYDLRGGCLGQSGVADNVGTRHDMMGKQLAEHHHAVAETHVGWGGLLSDRRQLHERRILRVRGLILRGFHCISFFGGGVDVRLPSLLAVSNLMNPSYESPLLIKCGTHTKKY